jgi:hypothetical protein
MQETIITLLIASTLIQVWVNELPFMLGKHPIPYKPFNCSNCLSFWIGLILSIILFDITFLLLYLLNLLIERVRL